MKFRGLLKLWNLFIFGFIEQWSIFPIIHFLLEELVVEKNTRSATTSSSATRRNSAHIKSHIQGDLALSNAASTTSYRKKMHHDIDFWDAQMRPWLYNNFAILCCILATLGYLLFLLVSEGWYSRVGRPSLLFFYILHTHA